MDPKQGIPWSKTVNNLIRDLCYITKQLSTWKAAPQNQKKNKKKNCGRFQLGSTNFTCPQ